MILLILTLTLGRWECQNTHREMQVYGVPQNLMEELVGKNNYNHNNVY